MGNNNNNNNSLVKFRDVSIGLVNTLTNEKRLLCIESSYNTAEMASKSIPQDVDLITWGQAARYSNDH